MGIFSKVWGKVGTLQGMINRDVVPLDQIEDPIHAERMERYKRNLLYYLQAQYDDMNAPLFMADSPNVWAKARVNYTGVIPQTVDTKADWLYGESPQVQFQALSADLTEVDPSEPEKDVLQVMKRKFDEIYQANELAFWEWMGAVIGQVCGDTFWYVYVEVDTGDVKVELIDPMLVFPFYSQNLSIRVIPALQMRFNRLGDNDTQPTTVIRDWRMTPKSKLDLSLEFMFGDLENPSDSDLIGNAKGLTCVERKFENGKLVKALDLQIGEVPWVHVPNLQFGRSRYGMDEVSAIIPKVEKYNDLMRYAERIARVNANAKLGVIGARPGKLRGDADDVIYFPEGSTAQVISLPSDIGVLNFIKEELKDTMYKDAAVPREALGEGDMGSNMPALSLELKFQRLVQITRRHRVTYGTGVKRRDSLILSLDEKLGTGSSWSQKEYKEEFVWYDAMPKSRSSAITDGNAAAPGKQLVSLETIQEWIPGVDPAQEKERLEREGQESQQAMLAQQDALIAGAGDQTTPTETVPPEEVPPTEDQLPPEDTGNGNGNGNGNGKPAEDQFRKGFSWRS